MQEFPPNLLRNRIHYSLNVYIFRLGVPGFGYGKFVNVRRSWGER